MSRESRRAAKQTRRILKREEREGERFLLDPDRRRPGRPRKEGDGAEIRMLTDVRPFPLSGPGGELDKARTKVSKYEGQVLEYADLAVALRVARYGASPKRFSQRAREQSKALILLRRKVAELEEAVADCAGIDYQEREVYRAMNSAHSIPGGPKNVARRSLIYDDNADRQRRFQKRRRRQLEGVDILVPESQLVFESEAQALAHVARFMEKCREEVQLITDEIQACDRRREMKQIRELRRARNTYVRDLEYLGADVKAYAGDHAIVIGRRIGRPPCTEQR